MPQHVTPAPIRSPPPTQPLLAHAFSGLAGALAMNVHSNERGVQRAAAHPHIDAVEQIEVRVRRRLEHSVLRPARHSRAAARLGGHQASTHVAWVAKLPPELQQARRV